MLLSVFIFLGLYVAILVFIGYYSSRMSMRTTEDFYMAGRTVGALALLVSSFAANMSAFGLIGFPAMAYTRGVGALGYLPSAMWLAGLGYFVFCYRAWLLGRRFGHMTPTEILNSRTHSKVPGTILFILYAVYTVPYLMTGLVGAGVIFETLTDGVIPYWLGALIPFAVTTYYVVVGGFRVQCGPTSFKAVCLLLLL